MCNESYNEIEILKLILNNYYIIKYIIFRFIKFWFIVIKCFFWLRFLLSNLVIVRVDIVFIIYMYDLLECKLILFYFWLDYIFLYVLYI